jgi:hypothetical protein
MIILAQGSPRLRMGVFRSIEQCVSPMAFFEPTPKERNHESNEPNAESADARKEPKEAAVHYYLHQVAFQRRWPNFPRRKAKKRYKANCHEYPAPAKPNAAEVSRGCER